MEKILGLDLGTNSIGWAIRNTSISGNQFVDAGVLTFDKGVGEGKSGEFPLVQKRTQARGKRRNYQSEKYRKWALLELLIDQKMCPLTLPELNEWRKYKKGSGRKYPESENFMQWLRYDFDGDGKPDFCRLGFSKHESYYLFRMLAVSEGSGHRKIFKEEPYILGRVFYHLVQRRGFRGRDEEESKTIMQGSKENNTVGVDAITPFLEKYNTLGAALYYMQKSTNERIRKRYNLRTDYENELEQICRVQHIDDSIYKKLRTAITWQRPLRSQKGLVGVCTFEKNKSRCPISHPLYEEFRTWVYINNLKIHLPEHVDRQAFLHEKIYPLFYNASRDFKLSSITKEIKKAGGQLHSKFKDEAKVVSCTLLNAYKNLLGDNWKEISGWYESLFNQPKNCSYSFEDIWHVLFTFDDRSKLVEFATDKLSLSPEDAHRFSKISLQQGYATLSLSAIRKILPYLHKGYLYSHAVYLANLPKVMGIKNISPDIINAIVVIVDSVLKNDKKQRQVNAVINGLISDQLNGEFRFGMDQNYTLDEDDKRDVRLKILDVVGEKTWNTPEKWSQQEKAETEQYICEKYLDFLRKPINAKKENLFIKTERLHDRIFNELMATYDLPESNRKLLWHPSEQESYPPADLIKGLPQLGAPQPISRGFKNPMALKTLHKLKNLLNYLLQAGKIDEDTRIVIEIARELNDANKRKAIEKYQREREKENEIYRKEIEETATMAGLNLDVLDKDVLDKYRLWIEQNRICLYTGKVISFTDLFKDNKFDFEHTIPASISFDNELNNLTIADGLYNRQVKQNQIPTELPNYNDSAVVQGTEYTAIKPRLRFIEEKVEHLKNLLEEWKLKTKYASSKDIKDACIQRRHLIKFDLDYWTRKLHTFTLVEYKAGWRNSQLRDTQIVTKYALPYLKTVFHKVEVQKAAITTIFKEVYNVKLSASKKNRDKHSHHAEDAAILTLIPTAAVREKIILHYNEVKDKDINDTYHEAVKNWPNFNPQYILSIGEEILINFQASHRTLNPTYKNVRKRGKQQFLRQKTADGKWQYKLNEKGEHIPLIARGDSIRGQLHKESFFGAIKLAGELCLVERQPIAGFRKIEDCRKIVDDAVKKIVTETLQARMNQGMTFDKAKLEPIPFPSGKAVIKKVRCKVAAGIGYLTPEKALEIKRHAFLSKHDYKQQVYAQNEENTICLYYQDTENTDRAFRIVGLFELAGLKLTRFEEIVREKYYQTVESGRGKNKKVLPLFYIVKQGMKVLLYKENIEELKDLPKIKLQQRLYRVYKFNDPAPSTTYVYLQHHLEARPNDELGMGDKDINWGEYQPRIFLNAAKFKCALEDKHFLVKIDGSIEWLI